MTSTSYSHQPVGFTRLPGKRSVEEEEELKEKREEEEEEKVEEEDIKVEEEGETNATAV